MTRDFLNFAVLGAACSVAVLAGTVAQTIAATPKAKEPVPIVAAKPAKHPSKQGQSPSLPPVRKSPLLAPKERQPETVQRQARLAPSEIKRTGPKTHQRLKAHSKRVPKAVVQPRTDLMYHGMLESPQRYDLRRNHLGVGFPNPHVPELTHGHFQELDRNQDGLIDPIERAFSRLDIDRDLQNHRLR
jgi:hypothetical protein